MSVKVERLGEGGARIFKTDSSMEIEGIDEIRTVIQGLETILEDIYLSNRKGNNHRKK